MDTDRCLYYDGEMLLMFSYFKAQVCKVFFSFHCRGLRRIGEKQMKVFIKPRSKWFK